MVQNGRTVRLSATNWFFLALMCFGLGWRVNYLGDRVHEMSGAVVSQSKALSSMDARTQAMEQILMSGKKPDKEQAGVDHAAKEGDPHSL